MFETALPKNAKNALGILGQSGILPVGSYLAGGTALAIQIGHRLSVDFDFFTPSEFDNNILSDQLAKIGTFVVTQKSPNTLLGEFNGVKFSIFTLKYSLIAQPVKFLGVDLASIQDIAAMKLAAILARSTKKDYIDLYFIDKNGFSLEKCLSLYEEKYGNLKDNLYSLITGLNYPTDAEGSIMPKMFIKVSWKEVKKFFGIKGKRLGDSYLNKNLL